MNYHVSEIRLTVRLRDTRDDVYVHCYASGLLKVFPTWNSYVITEGRWDHRGILSLRPSTLTDRDKNRVIDEVSGLIKKMGVEPCEDDGIQAVSA